MTKQEAARHFNIPTEGIDEIHFKEKQLELLDYLRQKMNKNKEG